MNFNWRQLDIRIYAVAASLLISVFTILFAQQANDDAYTYIRTAELIHSEGITAAFQHYSWASYSTLIYLVSLLGTDLFTSAYIVNGLFYALLVFAFISIVKEVDDSDLTLELAAITILVYPELNEYRYFIIRDTGFWALCVLSLWQFLKYSKSPNITTAAIFCSTLLLASLLRAEAALYLLLVPLVLLLDQSRISGFRSFANLYALIIASIVAALAVSAVVGMDIQQLFIRFVSVYEPFLNQSINPSQEQSYEIARTLFNEHAAAYSQEYITLFMIAGLTAVLLANLSSGIGGPFLLVYLAGLFRGSIGAAKEFRKPVFAFMLVNLLILFSFVFLTRYLSSRYTILMCILLSLFVPFILSSWLRARNDSRNGVIFVIALLFTYCFVDSYFSFGKSKDYLDDAVEWVVQQRDSGRSMVTNNHALAYHSELVENYDQTLLNLTEYEIFEAKPGDIVAIEMRYEMQVLVEAEHIARLLQLETAFPSSEDQRIAIYRRIEP